MEARSNWAVESVVELQDAIQESNTFPKEDLADLLDEEKCFSLTRPEGSKNWCQIKLRGLEVTSGTRKVIKGILLHSEAKVVEVYVGEHEEYLKTEHGRRLGEYEDTEMSVCEVRLDTPRPEVTLTFKHTYNPNCVWVFGLHVVTETVSVESRFTSGHLSSVLKEKEVNMSKDGARFLNLLESFNGAQFNENNQLALMSMFLGPKMVNKPYNKGTELNYTKQKESNGAKDVQCQLKTDVSVTDADERNRNDVESKMKELAITEDNMSTKQAVKNNGGGYLYKDSQAKSQAKTLVGNNDGMIEKLFMLMGNVRGQSFPEQQKTQGQHGITKPASLPPPGVLSSLLQPSSSQGHTMQALMESVNRKSTATNNFHPSHSAASGPAHSTPRAKESDNNNVWPADDVCGGFSLEGSGLLLREIENIIDRKFAQMEERLVKRIEEKVAEKAECDSKRLERIEEHLLKLCEHLPR